MDIGSRHCPSQTLFSLGKHTVFPFASVLITKAGFFVNINWKIKIIEKNTENPTFLFYMGE